MVQGRVPLILAGIFALLAGLVAYLSAASRGARIAEEWDPIDVMIVTEDLSAGSELTQRNVGVGRMPRSLVTPSVMTYANHERAPVLGRRLALPVRRGDILLYTHILTKTGEQQMGSTVQKPGRAISIRVGPESSVHNWIEPSDRVDVLGTFRDPKSGELMAVTLLQNVIVLATGRVGGQTHRSLMNEAELNYTTVTLQVLPEAAEMLVLAQDMGSLYLTLRNNEDTEVQDISNSKTTIQTLLTGERSKRLSNDQSRMFKPPPRPVVEVIRGRPTDSPALGGP